MSKHTEGPWVRTGEYEDWSCDTGRENSYCFVGPIDEPPVAIVVVPDAFNMDETLDANASLISAALEMMEALKSLLKLHEAHHNHPDHVAARAAIAKAEGRT